jgi:hypothetical protein
MLSMLEPNMSPPYIEPSIPLFAPQKNLALTSQRIRIMRLGICRQKEQQMPQGLR